MRKGSPSDPDDLEELDAQRVLKGIATDGMKDDLKKIIEEARIQKTGWTSKKKFDLAKKLTLAEYTLRCKDRCSKNKGKNCPMRFGFPVNKCP